MGGRSVFALTSHPLEGVASFPLGLAVCLFGEGDGPCPLLSALGRFGFEVIDARWSDDLERQRKVGVLSRH